MDPCVIYLQEDRVQQKDQTCQSQITHGWPYAFLVMKHTSAIHQIVVSAAEDPGSDIAGCRAGCRKADGEQHEQDIIKKKAGQRYKRECDHLFIDPDRIADLAKMRTAVFFIMIDRGDRDLHDRHMGFRTHEQYVHFIFISFSFYLQHLRQQFTGKDAQSRLCI